MLDIIITNNSLAYDALCSSFDVRFLDLPLNDLLKVVRDYVHDGYRLLSHPLSGSVKPNENPFKSVMLFGKKQEVDFDSVRIIENACLMASKFPIKFKSLSETMKKDFQTIDLSLISSCR